MVRGSPAELAANLDQYKVIGYGGGMLTVRAIKEYADGALGSRGAWLLEPYEDKPDSVGLPRPTMTTLLRHREARDRPWLSARRARYWGSRKPRSPERVRGGVQGGGQERS